MAGKKKQEIQLQREIETQEEWEECMAREGIWVVDVYQEWCGPCQALVANFRRLKNELGDPLLNYAIAKADTIDALERYRGRCEPTFLFYAGGILVSFVHGANAPKIQRTITEQLAQEHKVLEGQAERKEVNDPVLTRAAEKEIAKQEQEQLERELEALKYIKAPKGITVAIIKPDAVAQGKADEIISEIKENNIEILADEEKLLTQEEAAELYKELEAESYFDDLIKFVTSGPCRVLVLTKGNTGETVVDEWRNIIGPTNVEAAKEESPTSLRAKYGDSGYVNALHGSSTKESAARELAFFFPQLAVPTYRKKKENIQRTLAIIRPEAFSAKKDEILEKISQAGFKIALYKEIQLNKEQVSEFYSEHEGQSYFDQLVDNMTSGPVLALCLAGDDAISGWREMLGPSNVDDAVEVAPNSLRANFQGSSGLNQFHGSDTEEKAKKELDFFFPMQETVAVIKPSGMGTKDAIIDRIHEAGFKIAARKETAITKDIAEMLYPSQTEKEYYEDLVDSMTSGPTMFMVLTREDAVHGWRQIIGDTDPEEAKINNPTSIRAQFGQDILNNVVHGSSDPEHAQREIKAVFGNDAMLKGQEPDLEEASEGRVQALKIDRTDPETTQDDGADTTAGETTTDQTADTTQEVTTDQTQDQTVDPTSEETTTGDTNANQTGTGETIGEETTQMDETTAEETEAETTAGDTTVADTTVADTTAGDITQEPTADETQMDETQADVTQAEETPAEQSTQDATTDDKTEPASTEPETTAGETTTASEEKVEASQETPAPTTESVKEEKTEEVENTKVEESSDANQKTENQDGENGTEKPQEEENQKTETEKSEDSQVKEEEPQSKGGDTPATTEQATTES